MQVSFRGHPLQSPERPDTFFGLVAGLYVAALVSPAALVGVANWVSADAAVLYPGLLVTVTVVTAVVTWGVTRWQGLPERLGSTRLAWLLPLVGFGATFGYFGMLIVFAGTLVTELSPGGATSAIGAAGFFMGLVAAILGFGLVVMARNRLVDALVDDNAVAVEWTAGWPRRLRTRIQRGAAVVVVAVVVASLVSLWQNIEWWFELITILGPLAVVLLSVGSERTYRVTPAGLEVKLPVTRRLEPWDQFRGVEVTDDAIVLRQRFPHVDIRCARDQLDGEDAVLAALDEHLDRL